MINPQLYSHRKPQLNISNGCSTTDENKHFCDNNNLNLIYYINGKDTKDIMNYVLYI